MTASLGWLLFIAASSAIAAVPQLLPMVRLFHYHNFGSAAPLANTNTTRGTSPSCAHDALHDGDQMTDRKHVAPPEHVEEEDLSIYVDDCVRVLAHYGHWNGQRAEVFGFLKTTLYFLAGCVVYLSCITAIYPVSSKNLCQTPAQPSKGAPRRLSLASTVIQRLLLPDYLTEGPIMACICTFF